MTQHPPAAEAAHQTPDVHYLFPPSLVPVLRRQISADQKCCRDVSDRVLAELLTAVFFAGLETEEGEHHPIRVVFVGECGEGWLATDDGPEMEGGGPIYRWSTTRFETPRPFTVPELVKLSVVTSSGDRVYTKVRLSEGRLQIVGLAREGFNYEGDPYLKVMVPKPGSLSIRTGHDRLLDYERGSVLTGGEDVAISAGPVRRALEGFARGAELTGDAVGAYLDMVRTVVREMAAHGRGGILVITAYNRERVRDLPGYRTAPDGSPISLLRELQRGPRRPPRPPARHGVPHRGGVSLGEVLRGTFLSEAERIVQEVGATTATDGATLLDSRLALIGFGIVLPVAHRLKVSEAQDVEGERVKPFDFSTRGTRHLAAATFAHSHPGCVVFVASQDGEVGSVYRDPAWDHPRLWRFGPRR